MNIKELFEKAEGGTLTYEQFTAAATAGGAKFVDLSEGQYVSKRKHDDEIAAKVNEITTLNGTIATRDTDLADLKKKLEEAGTDSQKLTTLSGELAALQSKYEVDVNNYKQQLQDQSYEFAVKDFAATQKFTSAAAKREFTRAMIDKKLKMEKDKILGAEDFVTAYKAENADSFITEDSNSQQDNSQLPQFLGSTPGPQGTQPQDPTGGFSNAFHFTGVRPNPNQNNNK